MSIDKREIASRFTEVVARVMDIRDQENEGIYPPHDLERWKRKYQGRDFEDLPPNIIQFNTFKPMVDMTVCQLMMALDDKEWEEITKRIPMVTPD